jgi:hypothetical protein
MIGQSLERRGLYVGSAIRPAGRLLVFLLPNPRTLWPSEHSGRHFSSWSGLLRSSSHQPAYSTTSSCPCSGHSSAGL